ncbi:MAG: hypothetical protein JST90_07535 [Bacteroidetes bacterium]|nr:hypothetical protein [Bacteroidota bacterium]
MKTILSALLLICITSDTFAQAFPSEKDVYDFMQMVVKGQKLTKEWYLDSEAPLYCRPGSDGSYLYTLDSALIPLREADKKFRDTCMVQINGFCHDFPLERFSIKIGHDIPSCLGKGDIAYMLAQREHSAAFRWDQKRLGFNKKPTYNYYYISVPLFSVDKTKAILMIEELCPGLCGQGHTLLYTLNNGKWTAESSSSWNH